MRGAAVVALLALLGACDLGERQRERVSDLLAGAQNNIAPANLPTFFDCLRERGQAVVAAHRGGPAPGFAENAIPTFEHTLAAAPAFLEIDISRTRDGVLVLMHDDTVDRTTSGAGAIGELTYADIEMLRLKDEAGAALEARVPMLREALNWAEGRTVLELDIKRGVAYEDVIREVREAGATNRVILISYSIEAALRLGELAPEMMLSVPIEEAGDIDALTRAGVDLAHVLAWTGTDEPDSALNAALAARGVEVLFGTLGGGSSWDARFAREGADQYAAFAETGLALIATGRPIEAVADLDANDGAEGYGALQCVSAP